MVAKRALVVDDSRSARAFLAKLLEEQQIEVNAAESAEQAIEYLAHHRPDVIFMDHLMPGMDGFQAVQAIKANPATAAIPILMYTSQEGELYLGQARALGAVGVVQKNMAPHDVRALLQQLRLVPGAPPAAASSAAEDAEVTTAEMPTMVAPAVMELPAAASAMELQLKDEIAALRREFADALQAHSEQMTREVRSVVRSAMPAPVAPWPMLPSKPRQNPWGWSLAVAASLATAVLGTLWWQQSEVLDAARSELKDSRSIVALLTARLASARPIDGVVLSVPFGEAPLDGARVEALREFVAPIAVLEQPGTIEVTHFAGLFCLTGSASGGFALADAALPAGKCDVVAEPTDPAGANLAAESPAFAAALAELRKQYTSLAIDVVAAKSKAPRHAYPEGPGSARNSTAGEWNAVATANNRVEMRWLPAQ
jgi:CheY-like chemotaxis protein